MPAFLCHVSISDLESSTLPTRQLSGQARSVGRDLARLVVTICLGRGESVRDIVARLGGSEDSGEIIGSWQYTQI